MEPKPKKIKPCDSDLRNVTYTFVADDKPLKLEHIVSPQKWQEANKPLSFADAPPIWWRILRCRTGSGVLNILREQMRHERKLYKQILDYLELRSTATVKEVPNCGVVKLFEPRGHTQCYIELIPHHKSIDIKIMWPEPMAAGCLYSVSLPVGGARALGLPIPDMTNEQLDAAILETVALAGVAAPPQPTAERTSNAHAHGIDWNPPAGFKEYIVCAAIRNADGVVITGVRHYDLLMNAMAERLGGRPAWRGAEQGFVSNKYPFRFLTREEAYVIAVAAGQIRNDVPSMAAQGQLDSSHLY